MGIICYKLALPNKAFRRVRGFMISNVDTLEWGNAPECLSRPPIEVVLLNSNRKNLVDCLVGANGSWIGDMKEQVIIDGIAGWRLTEVEFRRRSPRLVFRTDGTGGEKLYIADDVSVTLAFKVHRDKGQSPRIYTVYHDWELYGKSGQITYLTSKVEESIDGRVLKRIEFDCLDFRSRSPEFYATHPEEYITITELC